VTPARPVFNASSWADVTGPLRSLWEAWKAEQAANGVQWDDEGHITNINGARIISSFRADSVPAEAVAWMTQNAGEVMPGSLVADSSGAASTMLGQEMSRVADEQRSRNDALDQMNRESSAGDGGSSADGAGDSPIDPGRGGQPTSGEGDDDTGADASEDVPDMASASGTGDGDGDGSSGSGSGSGTADSPGTGLVGGDDSSSGSVDLGDSGGIPDVSPDQMPDMAGGIPEGSRPGDINPDGSITVVP